jgi:hypothetical protein
MVNFEQTNTSLLGKTGLYNHRSEGNGHYYRGDRGRRLIGIGGGLSRFEEQQELGLNNQGNKSPGVRTPGRTGPPYRVLSVSVRFGMSPDKNGQNAACPVLSG